MEVAETLCAPGDRGPPVGPVVGVAGGWIIPPSLYTGSLIIPPFRVRALVGAFPGRAIPRARVPFRPDHICVLTGVLYSWLKCQLSGDVLHVFDVICSRLKCQLSVDTPHI